MSCYFKCPVALPRSAVGGSAVCDCGISRSYSFTERFFFEKVKLKKNQQTTKFMKKNPSMQIISIQKLY